MLNKIAFLNITQSCSQGVQDEIIAHSQTPIKKTLKFFGAYQVNDEDDGLNLIKDRIAQFCNHVSLMH